MQQPAHKATKMTEFINLPNLSITKDLIERIQFSLSSRNAENKVAECAVHVFASRLVENLQEIQWQYVASGVPCMLRNRELTRNGRKYMWSMNLCLYSAQYGVLVWKSKLAPNCEYTAVADNFHVFALSEVNVIVGMMFSSKEQACELNTLYSTWHQQRQRDDGKKGSAATTSGASQPARFRKEMISKPCNFQHIQGTQALDECLEIEKTKADIIAALFGLGTSVGRSEADGSAAAKKKASQSKKSKHEISKPKMTFKMINVPQTSLNSSPPVSPSLSPPASASETSSAHEQLHMTHTMQVQATVDITNCHLENQENFAAPDVILPPSDPIVPPQIEPVNQFQPPEIETVVQFQPAPMEQPSPVEEPAPVEQPLSVVTTDFVETSSNQFMDTEPASNSQDSQPPPMYDQLDPKTDGVYNTTLEPSKGMTYNNSQGNFGYSQSPPRLDLNLEKEFTESVLFQSALMSAN